MSANGTLVCEVRSNLRIAFSNAANPKLGEVALRHESNFGRSPSPVKQNEAKRHFA